MDQALKQYGLSDESDRYDDDETVKRAMGMLRLGRARSRQSGDRRTMSALRLGRRGSPTIQNIDSLDAPAAASLQPDDGELSSQDFDKRKSMSLLRLGRGHENQLPPDSKEEEKKAMSALRLGRKRGTDFRDANEQRDDNGVSTPAEDDTVVDVSSGVVKRAMSMLRLGRNMNTDDESLDSLLAAPEVDAKRAMSMLRLGRQSISSLPTVERRKSMSMLRLG